MTRAKARIASKRIVLIGCPSNPCAERRTGVRRDWPNPVATAIGRTTVYARRLDLADATVIDPLDS
jgi:hypothetical protein